MEKFFLDCDWGTSSFRLRLFDLSKQRVVGEIRSARGIAGMHHLWQSSLQQDKAVNKLELFRGYLQEQIGLLSDQLTLNLQGVTIMISGMASSSIGLEELPYAEIPFALDGRDTIIKRLKGDEGFPHEIVLISGVRTAQDVMRGEETQLVGHFAQLNRDDKELQEGVLIFPGTHSKHIYIQQGRVTGFETFMTGEVFNLMSNHSILKDSVENGELGDLAEENANAFVRGLQTSVATGVLNGLFTVRTNQLFGRFSKKQNTYYLSGLIIGEELKLLGKNNDLPLFLCSGRNLFGFYKLALDELNLSFRTTIVPFDLADEAAVTGQNIIFRELVLKDAK